MQSAVIFGTGATAIAAMREAALAGLAVTHVTEKLSDIARHSRYRERSILLPLSQGTRTLEELMRLRLEGRPALLWPTNDNQVKFVAENHDQLAERFFIPIPSWTMLNTLVDKFQLYQLAYKLQIAAPKVASGITPSELGNLALAYPCIVKPTQTPAFFEIYGRKVHIAQTLKELQGYYADALEKGLEVMVSEIIPGDDDSLENFVVYRTRSGKFVGEMLTRRIRQDPHGFGMATVVVTKALESEVQHLSRKLLSAAGFYGFAVIEWKRDQRNGKPTLIEVNPRPILSQRLCSRAGINYARIILEDAKGNPPRQYPYQEGIYWVDGMRDRYQFKRCRKLPDFSYRQFFGPYWKHPDSALPLLEDPGPWLAKAWLLLCGKFAERRRKRKEGRPLPC